jgi:hypothetical protein
MGEREARDLAGRIGGRAHHAGGNIWLVLKDRPDGSLLVVGDGGFSITTYAAYEAGDLDDTGAWLEVDRSVAVDRDGNVVDAGEGDDFDPGRDVTGRFPVPDGHWTILGA